VRLIKILKLMYQFQSGRITVKRTQC